MSTKNNVDEWIDYIYNEWLFKKSSTKLQRISSMRESSKILVSEMKKALEENRNGDVWHIIERLKKLSGFSRTDDDLTRKTDSPETLLECAITVYKLGDNEEALNLLGAALAGYASDWHYRAVSLWLKGCVQWLIPSHIDDAILQWEHSWELFKKYGPLDTDPIWYKKCADDMRQAIDDATKANAPQKPPTTSSTSPRPTGSIKRHSMRSLSIIGEIPAGQTYNLIAPLGAMEFEEVCLLGERHRIVNLRTGNVINIPQRNEHFILKVKGTSMNAATPEPIEDGDYVLMRNLTTPNHMDIVAAEIVGPDTGATLKRYRFENNSHYLYPESNDPNFQQPINPRPDWELGKDFRIRGVALAVLKKI